MRADRLISIILLLQTHERMTADDLADEVEVSTRTIYRDILALSQAGIPIYTDRGPGGGITLLESYRTTLTGMSVDEARALFMLNIPQALSELGVDQSLRSALLKLAGALPASQKLVQSQTQQRIYLDSTSWDEPSGPSPHLGVVHQAIWQDRLIRLNYHGSFGTQIEFVLEPLGLVAKMNAWYLVGMDNGYPRVLNMADILEVEILPNGFIRDKDFNLPAFWEEWCKASRDRRPSYSVRLAIAPTLLKKLHLYLGEAIKYDVLNKAPGNEKEWVEVGIIYDNFFQARESILNFGCAARILEPEALKLSVIDFASQIVGFYQADSTN